METPASAMSFSAARYSALGSVSSMPAANAIVAREPPRSRSLTEGFFGRPAAAATLAA